MNRELISVIDEIGRQKGIDKARVIGAIESALQTAAKKRFGQAENIQVEFSIYNEKFKDIIIKEHTRKFVLPFYVTWLLCLVKLFYYTIPILSKSFYIDAKKWILNTLYGSDINTQFIVLDEQ